MLHTGVLFFEEDGFIVLSNEQMQRLMIAITGRIRRNGKEFYKLLTIGEIEPDCLATRFEDHDVCLLPDGSVWMFNAKELYIGRKKYTQLTATNITERWGLITELQTQNEELMQRQKELGETIDNLHILSRERELQKARMRAHDILGERLTLLLHTIRGEQALDYAMLRSMSHGLLDEIRIGQITPSPADALDNIKQEFETIGVEVLINGKFPEEDVKAKLFVDIIREATTNAVRHGLATKVQICMADSDGGDKLVITDNGHPPSSGIKEGGGITGMREKIKPFGGTLTLTIQPNFVLTVVL
jgi:signal transduction histidine kinase